MRILDLDPFGIPKRGAALVRHSHVIEHNAVIVPKRITQIEKAILAANLGYNPGNDGETIRIVIPELTEDRRREYVKQAKALGEEARVALRNIRQDTNNDIKKSESTEDEKKGLENEVQELISKFNKIVDEKLKEKEQELLTV